MKKLIYIAIMGLFFGLNFCFAASVSFKWDANTESDLAGYKIYQGTQSGAYNKIYDIPCGANDQSCAEYTVNDLADGTYYFAATAYDEFNNESAHSKELLHTVDLKPPGVVINFQKAGSSKNFVITVEEKD